MAQASVTIGENRLLRTVDARTRKALAPYLHRVNLGVKQSIFEPNKPIGDVYFPVDGVISLMAPTESGPPIEVATIGNEGMAGLPLFLGTDRSPGSCFSQVPGAALRMSAADFGAAIEKNGGLTEILHRYAQALMIQISQSTACNYAHSIQQRCARWLLMTHDRVRKDEFLLTQEFLAQMLGVRRATVNAVAGSLQRTGCIRYTRGRITVVNRKKLEALSCICYSIVRDEYDRLLSRKGR